MHIEPTPSLLRALAALALCTSAVFGAGRAQAQPESAPATRAAAFEAYERHHWTQAYAGFVRLAAQGDADAARIALLMARHGPALYGQSFGATPAQRSTWLVMQRCAGGCDAEQWAGAGAR